jgi:hypothetical protein
MHVFECAVQTTVLLPSSTVPIEKNEVYRSEKTECVEMKHHLRGCIAAKKRKEGRMECIVSSQKNA